MSTTTTVIILGMHRSGTSALAGSLQEQGLYLGRVFEENPHNKKGNRENNEIYLLNENILTANNGNWMSPPISIDWTLEQAARRDEIIESFIQSGNKIWGFKDPRTLFTLDFWLEGLKDVTNKYVGSFRHPLSVARSLHARDKMPMEDGFRMWALYNKRLLEIYERVKFPLVSFDVPASEYTHSISRVMEYVTGLQGEQADREHLFFDEQLRHQSHAEGSDSGIPEQCITLYETMKNIYQEHLHGF